MILKFPCRQCGQRYSVEAAMAGRRTRCKRCGEPMTIPTPRQPAMQAAPASPAAPEQSRPKPAPVAAELMEFEVVSGSAPEEIYGFGDGGAHYGYAPASNDAYGLDDVVPAAEALYDPDDAEPDFVLPRGKGRAEDPGDSGFSEGNARGLARVASNVVAVLLFLAATFAPIGPIQRVALAGTALVALVGGHYATRDRSEAAREPRERKRRERERKRADRHAESHGLRKVGGYLTFFGVGGFFLPFLGIQFKILMIFGAYSQAVAGLLMVPGILILLGTWHATDGARVVKYLAIVGALVLGVVVVLVCVAAIAVGDKVDPAGNPPPVAQPHPQPFFPRPAPPPPIRPF